MLLPNVRLGVFVDDFKRPKLHICFDGSVGIFASNQTFGVVDGVCRIGSNLVLRGVTNQSFVLCESDVRWSDTITLFVCLKIIKTIYDEVKETKTFLLPPVDIFFKSEQTI